MTSRTTSTRCSSGCASRAIAPREARFLPGGATGNDPEQTFCRWRNKYGGMEVADTARLTSGLRSLVRLPDYVLTHLGEPTWCAKATGEAASTPEKLLGLTSNQEPARTGHRGAMTSHHQIALPLAIALLAVTGAANAVTITFDTSPATNNNVPYSASLSGATFSATNAGIWDAISDGDPGGWLLQGTNGPQFLGFNGRGADDPAFYAEVVTFNTAISSASLDFARSNGSIDGTITLQAFDNAVLLGSVTTTLGTINAWSTLNVAFPNITSIAWSGTGIGYHPYGVDNFTFAVIPIPAAAWLLGSALGILGWMKRTAIS